MQGLYVCVAPDPGRPESLIEENAVVCGITQTGVWSGPVRMCITASATIAKMAPRNFQDLQREVLVNLLQYFGFKPNWTGG